MKKLLLIFNLFFLTISYSQNGIVKYTAELNVKHKKEFIEEIKQKKGLSMAMKQSVINKYKNAEPDYYELHFLDDESYYFKDKSLEKETSSMGSKAGRNPYYVNFSNNKIIEENVTFGYVSHKPLDWNTTRETKMIGGVKCYKATTTETLYSRQGHYYDREVVAWFDPETPVNFGPKYYIGLPGLVLEVERNEFIIKATKIKLNLETEKLFIDRVKKEEDVISEKEMHKRIAEKMKYYKNR